MDPHPFVLERSHFLVFSLASRHDETRTISFGSHASSLFSGSEDTTDLLIFMPCLMGIMLKDEIRLETLRGRLEDRPNNLKTTVQVGTGNTDRQVVL